MNGALLQLMAVALIVLAAAAYLARRVVRASRRSESACECGCATPPERPNR